jgi:hypothetical protein
MSRALRKIKWDAGGDRYRTDRPDRLSGAKPITFTAAKRMGFAGAQTILRATCGRDKPQNTRIDHLRRGAFTGMLLGGGGAMGPPK